MGVRAALVGGLLVALTTCVKALPASQPVTPFVVSLPTMQGPIATTDRSWPFASTEHSSTRRDLSQEGYEEQEYFISGVAHVYNWPAVGRLESFAQGPYTTRIIVRRPRNPAKFSGTVIVEVLNPSLRYDAAIMWIESQNYFLEHGDVYVGVTVKPVAIDSLQRFDPQRYAPLSMKNPLPAPETCPQSQLPPAPGGLPPESSPATENGLIWDILSQTGALVRRPAGPLRDLHVSRVYLTGDSQSGAFVLIYANAIHPFATLPGGKAIYDGYLSSSASGPGVPVNQCSPPAHPGDPRLVMQPRGVPIIRLINQTDLGYLNRRPDSDHFPDLYRGYEIAGAAHVHEWLLQWGADAQDVAKTGAGGFLSNAACVQHAATGSEFPTQYVLDAAFANLELWSRKAIPPPRAAPLEIGDPAHGRATLAVDEFGNARGGLRTPYVDVPLARYSAYMDGPGICELWGYQTPLPGDVLHRLYGSASGYQGKVAAATQRAVQERWITPSDARRIVREAASARIS